MPDNNKDGTSFDNLNYIPGSLLFLFLKSTIQISNKI